jgi:hypothetical protein
MMADTMLRSGDTARGCTSARGNEESVTDEKSEPMPRKDGPNQSLSGNHCATNGFFIRCATDCYSVAHF